MENRKPPPAPARNAAGNGESDDEEAQMEAFFALVRGFHEMRKGRRRERSVVDGAEPLEENGRKKMKAPEQRRSAWIPVFEKEDFDEHFQIRGPTPVFPRPCNVLVTEEQVGGKKTKREDDDDDLDLKLTL